MEVLDEFRVYLKTTPLSKEAQKIDQQLTDFVAQLAKDKKLPQNISDETIWPDGMDSVHNLLFSFLMLNTDIHVVAKRNNEKKSGAAGSGLFSKGAPAYQCMTLDNFIRNLRGVVNLTDEEFKKCYDDIAGEEIEIIKKE